jgi:hypothetical protein
MHQSHKLTNGGSNPSPGTTSFETTGLAFTAFAYMSFGDREVGSIPTSPDNVGD